MEKIIPAGRSRRILVTGPESTGKTELVEHLSRHYEGIAVPEYARDYISALPGPYGYSDVEHIARHQLDDYKRERDQPGWIFFDTWLIVTRVWLEVVFGSVPPWIDEELGNASFGLVLLCDTSLPWVPDPVRENGGPMREKLLGMYRNELDRLGYNWELVTGTGARRTENAIALIENYWRDANA